MREVIIIGGGVVGLWCAYHLHLEGIKVTIIDKGDLSDGCSFGNAGMIVPSHFIPMASPGIISKGIRWMFKKDSPFYIRPRMSLELAQWLWLFYRSATKKHVSESAVLLRDMHTESRELYSQLDQTNGFNFKFDQKGILMLFKSADAERDELDMAEAADRLGIEANYLTPDQLMQLEPGIQMAVRGALHYPGDAHLSPQMFMQQMMQHLRNEGVEIISNKEVIRIEDNGKSGCHLHLSDGEKMEATHLVVSTGSWSGRLMKKSGYTTPMQDGKGYSMTLSNPLIKPTIPSILHEARVAMTPMGDDLRISGTLEISGMDEIIQPLRVKGILNAVPDYYPGITINDSVPVWFGYRPCTPDGLPYIGRMRENSAVIMATGHAMIGLSLAPVTGRMVKDIIVQKNGFVLHKKLNPQRFA